VLRECLLDPGVTEVVAVGRRPVGQRREKLAMLGPILPLFEALLPKYATATDRVGLAMLRAAKHGAPKTILETSDIDALAREAA
jgi:hypothetical protein